MSQSTPEERLRVAFDLFEVGVLMTRSRLRREHPDFSDEQVEEAVTTWLQERPGAPFGDYPGPASTRVLGDDQ
ncbi:MAG: hypothetical protein IPJ15_08260 [Actinomycetales bacterium]|nr:hypothetical protein [Candidatus Phosphoribacter baldrii]